jgi:hypothetical protein
MTRLGHGIQLHHIQQIERIGTSAGHAYYTRFAGVNHNLLTPVQQQWRVFRSHDLRLFTLFSGTIITITTSSHHQA